MNITRISMVTNVNIIIIIIIIETRAILIWVHVLVIHIDTSPAKYNIIRKY